MAIQPKRRNIAVLMKHHCMGSTILEQREELELRCDGWVWHRSHFCYLLDAPAPVRQRMPQGLFEKGMSREDKMVQVNAFLSHARKSGYNLGFIDYDAITTGERKPRIRTKTKENKERK